MTTTVFLAVIGAAALHAIWNALVKSGDDKVLSMSGIVFGHIPPALVVLALLPLPSMDAWPYLIASIVLHTGYQLFLIASYRSGDLTQVYPIARGSAPILVAIVSVAVLGVDLALSELAAIALIAIGILSLGLVRHQDGNRNPNAAFLALTTGGFIASYSLIDGLGARVGDAPTTFYALSGLGNCIVFAIILMFWRRDVLPRVLTDGAKTFWIGGIGSFIAYAIVTWAFTQAPIALVTALRETSIIFALLIGVFGLRERLDLLKVGATFVVLSGSALIRIARH
ncbi:MAG: DMT family transporter [Pseudomonadota bacterium]